MKNIFTLAIIAATVCGFAEQWIASFVIFAAGCIGMLISLVEQYDSAHMSMKRR